MLLTHRVFTLLRLEVKSGRILIFIVAVAGALGFGSVARASGSATNISGLTYTGLNSSGGLQTGGSTDANWDVTYAYYDGHTYTGSSLYTGAAYTVLGSSIAGSGYAPNTSSAQWITAPGAELDNSGSSAANAGGLYLPGNGTDTSRATSRPTTYYQESKFVYTLAFTITGTGGTGALVTNAISINMTIAADDQYSVFVNPTGNGTTLPTGTASATGFSAWTNTTSITLQNGTNGTGTSGNAQFVIGTNYLVIEVDNTNAVSGSSTSTLLNASGLLVYQVGAVATINGHPVPEVGTWLPLLGAMGLYGGSVWRRGRSYSQFKAI